VRLHDEWAKAAFVIGCWLTGMPAEAQWVHQKTPGIPRKADGKADLTARAPRTADGKPDLSGMWRVTLGAGYVANVAADLKPGEIQPWAQALYQRRAENLGIEDPWTVKCLPLGPRHITNGGLARIIQTPGLIAILYEDLAYRQIHMDGRALPKDPDPSYMGYSVGHWEGDALVVDSIGFKDVTWLDMGGHPHTEALHITERFERRDFGHMDLRVTIDDPKAYMKAWTIAGTINMVPDTELLESVCAENEKDAAHLVGRTAAERQIHIAPEVLATYTGVYDELSNDNVDFVVQRFTVTLAGDQLYLDIGGKGRAPMFPLSETTFSPRLLGTYEFVKDASGKVTHLISYSTEGNVKAVRRP
jgi:hypothetical protein